VRVEVRGIGTLFRTRCACALPLKHPNVVVKPVLRMTKVEIGICLQTNAGEISAGPRSSSLLVQNAPSPGPKLPSTWSGTCSLPGQGGLTRERIRKS
jgi:hypothetical protein